VRNKLEPPKWGPVPIAALATAPRARWSGPIQLAPLREGDESRRPSRPFARARPLDRNSQMGNLLLRRVFWRVLFWWRRPDPIQSELVALAAEVAAATTSARAVLAAVPEGSRRTWLLRVCDSLYEAAGEVLDPRCQLQGFASSQLEEMFEIFMEYQEQSVLLRGAVYRLAGVPEVSHPVRPSPSAFSPRHSTRPRSFTLRGRLVRTLHVRSGERQQRHVRETGPAAK
jgi:hypothetical protein